MNEHKHHRYYRLLEKGEIIKEGDYKVKIPDQIIEVRNTHIGEPQGEFFDPTLRPVQVDEWISYSERKPTKEDGYKSEGRLSGYDGLVTAIFGDGSVGNHGWNSSAAPLNGATHWRRITPPQQPKPKQVDLTLHDEQGMSRQSVTIYADGRVTIPCGSRFSAESIDEFISKRKEVMEKDLH